MMRLLNDDSGVTVVEFALIAPVLLISLLGILDLSQSLYTASMLEGVIQKTARDSTIEGASQQQAALDQRVTDAVQRVALGSTLTFSRRSYTSYINVAKPEDFTDVDGNGACDNGDPYEDANGNGAFDLDRGVNGFGGARDSVAYTVTVNYPRLFPVAPFIGGANTSTLTETTVLRNQPYAMNAGVTPQVRNCP